jgi:hypothetical protein
MDETERQQRIQRRRRVVALIKAMHARDANVDGLIDTLAADEDRHRVIGALAVAGSTLADGLAKATGRSVDEVLEELEQGLTGAPVE